MKIVPQPFWVELDLSKRGKPWVQTRAGTQRQQGCSKLPIEQLISATNHICALQPNVFFFKAQVMAIHIARPHIHFWNGETTTMDRTTELFGILQLFSGGLEQHISGNMDILTHIAVGMRLVRAEMLEQFHSYSSNFLDRQHQTT